MKPKPTDQNEKIYPTPPIEQFEFLRPMPHKTDFSKIPKPKIFEERLAQDIEEQLLELVERYKKQGRRPSGSETYDVRQQVRAEHEVRFAESCIKLALWNQSERILRLLRTPGLLPVLEGSIYQQRQIEFINQLDLSRFPEADSASPLYLGTLPTELPDDYYMASLEPRRPDTGIGLNEYFEAISPDLVNDFGFPFYTSIKVVKRTQEAGKITGINKDFFAAFLRGQKRFRHDGIYYLPENRFYYYDPMAQ